MIIVLSQACKAVIMSVVIIHRGLEADCTSMLEHLEVLISGNSGVLHLK